MNFARTRGDIKKVVHTNILNCGVCQVEYTRPKKSRKFDFDYHASRVFSICLVRDQRELLIATARKS